MDGAPVLLLTNPMPRTPDASAKPARRTTGVTETALVHAALEHYAHRGSFRSFSASPLGRSRTQFSFSWFRDVTFRVVFDETRRTLTFVGMLPGIPARSEMDRELREFVGRHRLHRALVSRLSGACHARRCLEKPQLKIPGRCLSSSPSTRRRRWPTSARSEASIPSVGS